MTSAVGGLPGLRFPAFDESYLAVTSLRYHTMMVSGLTMLIYGRSAGLSCRPRTADGAIKLGKAALLNITRCYT